MAVKFGLQCKYDTVHENRFWNKLTSLLTDHYSTSDEVVHLIGNIIVEGKQIDALCIKNDAIIAIDFKDYAGKLQISENAPWIISGQEINAGSKNPYAQLHAHKFALLNTLEKRLPLGFEHWVNLGHINALVLFHQEIEYDVTKMKFDLSPGASKWFNLCDIDHLIQTLDEIVSDSTLIKGENRNEVLRALGVSSLFDGPTAVAPPPVDVPIPSPINNPTGGDAEEGFADIYYAQAMSLDRIKYLIIGQDPYTTNPNGVAFCKNFLYDFRKDNCSGRIVFQSLGIGLDVIDKLKADGEINNPKDLFLRVLQRAGICFTNISNQQTAMLSDQQKDKAVLEAKALNLRLINKAEHIILLGKTTTNDLFQKHYPGVVPDRVLIHPSLKARVNNEKEWDDVWTTNKLERIIQGIE